MSSESKKLTKFELHPTLVKKLDQLASKHPEEILSVWGANLRCYYASPSTISIPGGYTPEEMIGHLATEYLYLSDFAHVALTRSDVELTGKSIEMNVDFRSRYNERIRVRNRTIRFEEPPTGRLFFLTRTVPCGQKLSELDSL